MGFASGFSPFKVTIWYKNINLYSNVYRSHLFWFYRTLISVVAEYGYGRVGSWKTWVYGGKHIDYLKTPTYLFILTALIDLIKSSLLWLFVTNRLYCKVLKPDNSTI